MTKRGHPVVVLVNREEWEARQQLVRAEAREELRHRLKQLRERVTCAVVDVATADQSSVGGRTHERQQDQSTRWVEVGVSRARRRARVRTVLHQARQPRPATPLRTSPAQQPPQTRPSTQHHRPMRQRLRPTGRTRRSLKPVTTVKI